MIDGDPWSVKQPHWKSEAKEDHQLSLTCKTWQSHKRYPMKSCFFAGNLDEGTPVIPISALRNQNMDLVCEHIAYLPIPIRDYTSEPRLCGKHCFSANDRSAPMKRTLASYCTHFLKLARGNLHENLRQTRRNCIKKLFLPWSLQVRLLELDHRQ